MKRRHHKISKLTTCDLQEFSIAGWQPKGWLNDGASRQQCWSRNGKLVAQINTLVRGGLILLYYQQIKHGQVTGAYSELVHLGTTPCNFGGKRIWLICPTAGCPRRVKSLFLSKAGFQCRHCLDLVYESQRENWPDRQFRKADAIRLKLGWPMGFANGLGPKPPHMHRATFYCLVHRHNDLIGAGARVYLRTINVYRR